MGRTLSILMVLGALTSATAAEVPLVFEENRGQVAGDAAFVAQADGYRVLVRATGIEWGTAGRDSLELTFEDAAPAELGGFDAVAEKIEDVPAFRRLARSTPYPGIGVVFRGEGRNIAIELTVAPGADPSAIRFGLRGAQTIRIEGGDVVATLREGEIRFAVADGAGILVGDGADVVGLRLAAGGGIEPRIVTVVARLATDAEASEKETAHAFAAGCPGTIQFTNGGGTGLWQTAGNWNLGHVPLATDDVCIPAGFTVTLSTTAQSVNTVFVATASSLALSSSLTLAAASQIDGSLTVQSGGTLTGTGDVTCNGSVSWTAGTISGAASLFANAGLSISGASAHDLTGGRALHVYGTTAWTGTGGVRLGTAGSITNHGTWDGQSNASFVALGSPGAFTNLAGATFKKTVATGTTSVPVPFNNAGTVSVLTGTLTLSGGGAQAGSFTASAGAVLNFGGGTHVLASGSSVAVPSVVFDAGTVTIDGSYAVSSDTTIAGGAATFNPAATLTSVGSALTISTGSVSFGSGETVSPATLTISSGALQGADTINVSGLMTWNGGTLTGAGTINANGGAAIGSSAAKDLTGGRVLNLAGTTTWTGTGSVRLGTGGSINNAGTWDCQNDAQIFGLGSPGTFTNLPGALFRKSAGTATTQVSVPYLNSGSISLLSGTLVLAGSGTHAGTLTAAAGTTLRFGGGTQGLAAGSSTTSPSVVFDAGTITIDGAFAATSDTTLSGATVIFDPAATLSSVGSALTINGGTVTFGSGETVTPTTLTMSAGTLQGSDTINVSGLMTWNGGTVTGPGTINANGGAAIGSTSTKDLTGGKVLNTFGTTTWTATGSVRLGTGGSINNSGTWDAQSDAQVFGLGSPGTFTNGAGSLFKKSAGAGTTTLNVPYANSGAISILSGTLAVTGSGTHAGTITGAAGTTLRFNGGTQSLAAGSSTTAPSIVFDAGTITIDGAYAASSDTTIAGATVTFNAAATLTSIGALVIGNGTLSLGSGETVSPATLTMASGSLQGTDTINVSGLLTWNGGTLSGTGSVNANGGAAIGSASTKDLTGGRILNTAGTTTWTSSGSVRLGTGGTINNSGTWDGQSDGQLFALGSPGAFTNGAAGVFKKSAGLATAVGVPFANAGSVQALAASLQFSGGFTQTAGSTTLSGGTISSTTPLDIQGGTLTGIGTATASVSNGGHAVPGLSIGTLGLTGNYNQSSTGNLDVQIGGRIAGTEYDQVTVSGAATFAGTLNVALANGFVPVGGDSFTLMTYASSTGAFSTSSLPPLSEGCWRTFYNPTALVLEVWTVAPEVTGVKPGATKSTVSWNALPPAAGPTPTYDVMRGSLAEFPVGGKPSEVCIDSTTATSAADGATPSLGTGFYYLVRGKNACGVGGYGTRSNGTPRTPTVCP